MQVSSQLFLNMGKVLSFRLQQCFKPFLKLFAKGSSETQLFRHLSNHVFRSSEFRKYTTYKGHLFWKMCKI